jgi:hypothetical protein
MEFIDNSEDRNHRSMLDFWMCANDFRRRAKTSTNANIEPMSNDFRRRPITSTTSTVNVETMSNDFRWRPITSTTSNANVETMSNEVSTLLQNDAIIIYDKFISLQASSPLGFGSDIRLNLKLIFFSFSSWDEVVLSKTVLSKIHTGPPTGGVR